MDGGCSFDLTLTDQAGVAFAAPFQNLVQPVLSPNGVNPVLLDLTTAGSVDFDTAAAIEGTYPMKLTVNSNKDVSDAVEDFILFTITAVHPCTVGIIAPANAFYDVTMTIGTGVQTITFTGITDGQCSFDLTLTDNLSAAFAAPFQNLVQPSLTPNGGNTFLMDITADGSVQFDVDNAAEGTYPMILTVNSNRDVNDAVSTPVAFTVTVIHPCTVGIVGPAAGAYDLTYTIGTGVQTIGFAGISDGGCSFDLTLTDQADVAFAVPF